MSHILEYDEIDGAIRVLLVAGKVVDVGEWHSQDIRGVDQAVSIELLNVTISCEIPPTMESLQEMVKPNLPWAEEHFQERVSGQPLNPPPSHVNWPWASANEKHQTQDGEAFSHSYPERFWPKEAGPDVMKPRHSRKPIHGIRFSYGDLNDVVSLLARSPYTRQAYLPVWFPEDTGAVHGERVPCSLGYHFLLREGKLHCTYGIRSCDAVRYFRDDVYLACRLTQWINEKVWDADSDFETWENVVPGTLTMHIGSFHCFKGDLPKLRREYA